MASLISELPSVADSAAILTLSSTVSMAVSRSWSVFGDCPIRGAITSSVHTLLGSPWDISTSMGSVSLPNTVAVFPVSIVRVGFLPLTLMSPSGVRVVLSEVEFADGVAVFRFLVPRYRMLLGTAIAVCVDC